MSLVGHTLSLPRTPFSSTDFYRPETKLRKGYVFTPVCHSVHRGGCLPQCMLGYTPPQEADTPQEAETPPGSRHTPREADGYCCGRYASYWNAFLFLVDLRNILLLTKSISTNTKNKSFHVEVLRMKLFF